MTSSESREAPEAGSARLARAPRLCSARTGCRTQAPGAGGNEQGVLLMFSHQIVRLEARPPGGGGGAGGSERAAAWGVQLCVACRWRGGGGSAGAGGGGGGAAANAHVDPEFARARGGVPAVRGRQRDGWRAPDKGRGVEEMASGREAMCVAALLALSRALVLP